jgi:uncharacterized protein (DUF2384 family)
MIFIVLYLSIKGKKKIQNCKHMSIVKQLAALDRKSKGVVIEAYRQQFGVSIQTYQRRKLRDNFSEVEEAFLVKFIEGLKNKAAESAKEIAGA